jgi:hypothetical protein
MKLEVLVFVVAVLSLSCSEKKVAVTPTENSQVGGAKIKTILAQFRSGKISIFGKQRKEKDLYNAVYGNQIELIQKIIKSGADPNICIGENGWIDSNPLCVVAEDYYDTFSRRTRGENIPNPTPDIETLNVLLLAGADINKRPYIWDRVNHWNNDLIRQIKAQRKADKQPNDPAAMREQLDQYVNDVNRLLEAFLKAGADPDMKGHPYPFSVEAVKARITDEQAKSYFYIGSRAINVAIEKGSIWESQVDLLLRYTKLDKDSLEAARRSKDSKMIAKITRLWGEQNNNSAAP